MALATKLLSRIKKVSRVKKETPQEPPVLPDVAWFDQTDATDQVSKRAGGHAADERILTSWVRSGYAVVEGIMPHATIDSMLEDLDGTFTADVAVPGLEVFDLEFADDGQRCTVDHRALLTRPVEERLAARARSSWRVHSFIQHSEAADRVRSHPELRRIASLILGYPTEASYSINFHNGSRQDLHQDSCVFHLGVPNLIVGAWVACEDIVDGAGPLVYYPGSHRSPMFAGFHDYPETNLRTAPDAATAARYTAEVVADAENFEERKFLARKGDVLFWHGMLIHGGAAITEPGRTRKSLVLHFVPSGADVLQSVTSPARW